jgi:hypothetical protein
MRTTTSLRRTSSAAILSFTIHLLHHDTIYTSPSSALIMMARQNPRLAAVATRVLSSREDCLAPHNLPNSLFHHKFISYCVDLASRIVCCGFRGLYPQSTKSRCKRLGVALSSLSLLDERTVLKLSLSVSRPPVEYRKRETANRATPHSSLPGPLAA